MRILFVYPNITKQTTPQLGVSSLIGVLSEKHPVMLFDLTILQQERAKAIFMDNMRVFAPDIIMISCRSNEWGYVKMINQWVYPTPIVVGGIHATINTEEILDHVKMAIRGEGEEAALELVDRLQAGKSIANIDNLWLKSRGRIIRNPVRPLIQDLDSLPFPAWKAWHENHFRKSYITSLFKDIKCVGTFETSRGCPYSCSYCCNEYLQDLYKGKGRFHRRKSPRRVTSEIAAFKSLYPDCNFLYFVDDTFMVSEQWLQGFKELYDKTPFVFMTRPEMVTEAKMKLIAEMGGRAVSIGVENGNENFRRTVLNRHMSNEQIAKAFRIAKDFGLHTYSFNMVGLPYETRDDVLSTIELNKRLKPDKAQFTIFFPFKGTKLFDICKKEGYLNGNYPELFNYYDKSFLQLPNFKKGELKRWVKRAEKETKSK